MNKFFSSSYSYLLLVDFLKNLMNSGDHSADVWVIICFSGIWRILLSKSLIFHLGLHTESPGVPLCCQMAKALLSDHVNTNIFWIRLLWRSMKSDVYRTTDCSPPMTVLHTLTNPSLRIFPNSIRGRWIWDLGLKFLSPHGYLANTYFLFYKTVFQRICHYHNHEMGIWDALDKSH